MNARQFVLLCRVMAVCLFVAGAALATWQCIAAARDSYGMARAIERQFAIVLEKWERGEGESIEQAFPVRHWPDSWGEQQEIERTAPYADRLRELWIDQPPGLCFRYSAWGRADTKRPTIKVRGGDGFSRRERPSKGRGFIVASLLH